MLIPQFHCPESSQSVPDDSPHERNGGRIRISSCAWTGVWQNETGLSQGGALSVAFFVFHTDLLHQSLLNEGLGVEVPRCHFPCPMIRIVDGLFLCMESMAMEAASDMVDPAFVFFLFFSKPSRGCGGHSHLLKGAVRYTVRNRAN